MRALWLSTFAFADWCYRVEPSDICVEALDADGDGYRACDAEDCDDTNPAVNMGADEVAGNCLDEDCVNGLEPAATTKGLIADGGGAVLCGSGTNLPEVGAALSTSRDGGGPALVIGAPGAQGSGAAYVLDEDALNDALGEFLPVGEVSSVVITGENLSRTGSALARLDVNGDGEDELFIGMPGLPANSYGSRGGVVMVTMDDLRDRDELYLDTKDSSECPTSYCLFAGTSNSSNAALGSTLLTGVTGADDVPFLLATAPDVYDGRGAVALQLDGFSTGRNVMDAGLMVAGAKLGDGLGASIAATDLNGDGVQEALLGATGYSINSALVQPGGVYSVPLWSSDWDNFSSDSSEDYLLTFHTADRAHLGAALAAGDLDSDGYGELAVATSREPDASSLDADYVYLIPGGSAEAAPFEVTDLEQAIIIVTWDSAARPDGQVTQPLTLSLAQAESDPSTMLFVGQPNFDSSRGAFWAADIGGTLAVDLSEDGDAPNGTGEAAKDQLGSALARSWWEDQVGVAAGAPGWADRSGAVFWFTGATTFGEP